MIYAALSLLLSRLTCPASSLCLFDASILIPPFKGKWLVIGVKYLVIQPSHGSSHRRHVVFLAVACYVLVCLARNLRPVTGNLSDNSAIKLILQNFMGRSTTEHVVDEIMHCATNHLASACTFVYTIK